MQNVAFSPVNVFALQANVPRFKANRHQRQGDKIILVLDFDGTLSKEMMQNAPIKKFIEAQKKSVWRKAIHPLLQLVGKSAFPYKKEVKDFWDKTNKQIDVAGTGSL